MKIAIMQPYLFPYIGYFQLMHAVDRFVVFDDVQFINKGWINRNRILNAGKDLVFTVPLVKASRDALINERTVSPSWDVEREKFLKTLQRAYSKAPFYEPCYELISRLVRINEKNLAEYVRQSLAGVAEYLDIETPMMMSGSLELGHEFSGQERILEVCRRLGATAYVNAIGGRELYYAEAFSSRSIELSFIQSEPIVYPQFGGEFVPWLSIIDVMMFNPVERIREYLNAYKLVS